VITHPSQGEARICSLRKILKEKATTHVVSQYQLHAGCKSLVTALLAGRSYIFPGDVMNVCDFTDIQILANFYLLMYILCSCLRYKRVHHMVTQSLWLSMPRFSSKLSCLSGTYILITSPTRLRVATLANAKSPQRCWSWLLPQ
jgi:hypothetical protein